MLKVSFPKQPME